MTFPTQPGSSFLGIITLTDGTNLVYVHDYGCEPMSLTSAQARDLAVDLEHSGRWEDRDAVLTWAARVDQRNRIPAATLH